MASDKIKEPNVAGSFYSADRKSLSSQIEGFFSQANPPKIDAKINCLISPHAGYDYSGQVASFGYKALSGASYRSVFILAFNHRYDFSGVSVWKEGLFRTPLGDIEVDSVLAEKLIKENPNVKFDPKAFYNEHSLEVQLPFLQKALSGFKIVPVMIGGWDIDNCKMLAGCLKAIIGDSEDYLIIASTDMSHFHSYRDAVSIDKKALKYLEELDFESLYHQAAMQNIELCGLAPVITTLLYAKSQNIDNLAILKYANSGDITGQKQQVVGYVSCALYKSIKQEMIDPDILTKTQKARLLEIARKSLTDYLQTGKRAKFTESDIRLTKNKGAFVTLTESGQLRGCIGKIAADTPLYLTIADMAIEAATGDPRFYKVSAQELKNINIEISVLSPLEKIDDVAKIQVGKHGLIIRKGFNSGLLLPQVATEYNWDRDTFLEQTCNKAGLNKDAWKNGAEIYIFSAEVFGEEITK